MENHEEKLLAALDAELTQTCFELRQERLARRLRHCFAALLALFIIVPVGCVLLDISLTAFAVPVLIFLGLGTLLASPVILIRKGAVPS
ncbi:MAG: hypothetical protein FWF05_07475 [Oscillospiraceae bacterium]|nr:hypothetical protein [Oscillospiraceae bacterium]